MDSAASSPSASGTATRTSWRRLRPAERNAATRQHHLPASEHRRIRSKSSPPKCRGRLKSIYFVNSGSEATDLALLMARAVTGQLRRHRPAQLLPRRQHALGHGPDGRTAIGNSTCRTVSGRITPSRRTRSEAPGGRNDPEAGKNYAADVKSVIDYATSGAWSVVHRGIHPRRGRLRGFSRTATLNMFMNTSEAAGGLCIADEVQTGFGRTGSHFWGFESQGVMPVS